MKCTIPEISWHNRDPVLSIDVQPLCGEFYRLATGGTDCHILIWQMKILETGAVSHEVLSDLTRHQRSVNVVRWCPNGQYLASGDDDANIIIWQMKTDCIPSLDGDEEKDNKETWTSYKVLRGHKEDIYDLCWSPNGTKLLSGSIDNTAILWDLNKGKLETILPDHKGFVQGCAWDPLGHFLATLSSDRTLRIFSSDGKKIKMRINKGKLPVPESHNLHDKEVKYFHDDTFKSYFRRICFSPDGNLLLAPSGCVETEDCKKALRATYIFTLDTLSKPAAILPSLKQCTVAVKCCPILFELRPEGPNPFISLPYRMVFAVATDTDIILYDTQQLIPFAHLQKIHYTRLTDLTWSHDGLLLAASSTDGFCTLVTFEPNELGKKYEEKAVVVENAHENKSICDKTEIVDDTSLKLNKETPKKDINILDVKPKKPTILEQWTMKATRKSEVEKENIEHAVTELSGNNKVPSSSEKENSNCDKVKNKCVIENSSINKEISICAKQNNEYKENSKYAEEIFNNGSLCIIKENDIKQKEQSKKEVQNELVIEITDSPIKSRTEVPTLLTPKRIIPIKIGEVSSKKENRKLKSNSKTNSAKPIAIKRKPNKLTPNKTELKHNPLINFLNIESKTNEIVEILDESEARDAWKIESEAKKIIDRGATEIYDKINSTTTTEVPEDFKLQMEDTNNTQNTTKRKVEDIANENSGEKMKKIFLGENDKRKDLVEHEVNEPGLKTIKEEKNIADVEQKTMAKELLEKPKVKLAENDLNVITKEENKIQIKNECSGTKDLNKQNAEERRKTDLIKTPRRVPLITLSSPRNKKRKVEEN